MMTKITRSSLRQQKNKNQESERHHHLETFIHGNFWESSSNRMMMSDKSNSPCNWSRNLVRFFKWRNWTCGWGLMKSLVQDTELELSSYVWMLWALTVSKRKCMDETLISLTISSNSSVAHAKKLSSLLVKTSAKVWPHTLLYATSCKSKIDTMETFWLILKVTWCTSISDSFWAMHLEKDCSLKMHRLSWHMKWWKFWEAIDLPCLVNIESIWNRVSWLCSSTLIRSLW